MKCLLRDNKTIVALFIGFVDALKSSTIEYVVDPTNSSL
jgi:hypothetical protein